MSIVSRKGHGPLRESQRGHHLPQRAPDLDLAGVEDQGQGRGHHRGEGFGGQRAGSGRFRERQPAEGVVLHHRTHVEEACPKEAGVRTTKGPGRSSISDPLCCSRYLHSGGRNRWSGWTRSPENRRSLPTSRSLHAGRTVMTNAVECAAIVLQPEQDGAEHDRICYRTEMPKNRLGKRNSLHDRMQ